MELDTSVEECNGMGAGVNSRGKEVHYCDCPKRDEDGKCPCKHAYGGLVEVNGLLRVGCNLGGIEVPEYDMWIDSMPVAISKQL